MTGEADISAGWAQVHVSPLWENRVAHNAKGNGPERAHIWRWQDMQPAIEQALAMTSVEAIERRVLSLVSPHSPQVAGQAGTTLNLNAGLQILKPGETARPHRHSMSALRFVMHGHGAVTAVNGKECPMNEFDLVTTPGWCWHEHIHRGDAPIIWLDILDASLHRYFGTDRFEPGPSNAMPAVTPDGAFAFAGMTPEGTERPAAHSPLYRYPWTQASQAVSAAPAGKDGMRRVRYANPLDGGPVMMALDCYLCELDAGSHSAAFRSTANAVCMVVAGEGESRVGDETFAWAPRDVFSLPRGNWITHRALSKARLFMCTDRDVLRRLDLLTEEWGN
ncbi:MAG: cupin domain-containing protein [Hyphomicrobiales bacterium]|nr:cupin domain-containing protein [Hyphomicrobiales bacterium]